MWADLRFMGMSPVMGMGLHRGRGRVVQGGLSEVYSRGGGTDASIQAGDASECPAPMLTLCPSIGP